MAARRFMDWVRPFGGRRCFAAGQDVLKLPQQAKPIWKKWGWKDWGQAIFKCIEPPPLLHGGSRSLLHACFCKFRAATQSSCLPFLRKCRGKHGPIRPPRRS